MSRLATEVREVRPNKSVGDFLSLSNMNINEPEYRVLRILSSLKGNYLQLDGYDESVGTRLERAQFPLSREELWKIARALMEKGLVASIHERLDGILIALTAVGRKHMETEGAVFDAESVERTRQLFEDWLSKAEM